MFSFPGGISLKGKWATWNVAHSSARESRKPWTWGQLWPSSLVSLGLASPPDSSPGPGGQHQAFFLSGLWLWDTRSPSSPTLLSLCYIVNPDPGPRLSELKFCLYLLHLCDFGQVMSFFLFYEVRVTVHLRVKIINLYKALRAMPGTE